MALDERQALDLCTMIARLEQLDEHVRRDTDNLAYLLWDRVMTCDVPRIRAHVAADQPATMARLDQLQAELEQGAASAG